MDNKKGQESMKYVLLTGASGGLGYELSKYLLDKGYYVVMLYHNNDNVKDLEDKYENSIAYQIDLTNDDEIIKLNDYLKAHNIIIDILINNAAIENTCDINSKTKDNFMRIYELNAYVPFKLMNTINYNTCVNISSDNTIDMFDEVSIEYDLSKTSLNMLGPIFKKKYPDRIYNTICFGWLDTQMNDYIDDDMKEDIKFVPINEACEEIEKLFDNQEMMKIIRYQ